MSKAKIMSHVAFVLASLGIVAMASAQPPPANVAGSWTMYVVGTKTGETLVRHVEIAQDGTMLSGYYEGTSQSGPIRGTIRGHHIHFIPQIRHPVNFFGDVFGNHISGTYLFHGVRQTWQATREPQG